MDCEPKPNKVFEDGAGTPKAKGEGWVKVEALLGAELDLLSVVYQWKMEEL